MNEREWVQQIVAKLHESLAGAVLLVEQARKIPYSYEVLEYQTSGKVRTRPMRYETDILISERLSHDAMKPRVIIEAKIRSVTTHDAITYSQKAAAHKQVHPYLRYGIILGARRHYPLPGRLFRHGANFDFMQSFVAFEPSSEEWTRFLETIGKEVEYSKLLEEIILNSRSRNRKAFTTLQKALDLR